MSSKYQIQVTYNCVKSEDLEIFDFSKALSLSSTDVAWESAQSKQRPWGQNLWIIFRNFFNDECQFFMNI